jgi:hypothetical protein
MLEGEMERSGRILSRELKEFGDESYVGDKEGRSAMTFSQSSGVSNRLDSGAIYQNGALNHPLGKDQNLYF